MGLARADALALDAADPLAPFVGRFVVADPDLCYLDGNSLGRLPVATVDRLRVVVEEEWGRGLVRSWESWFDLPTRVGDAIGALIGAAPGEVVVTDSVTVDLHAVVEAACAARPGRSALVVPAGEFPTDRYVVAGVAAARGMAVRHDLGAVDEQVACVVASVVDFRSGELLDVEQLVARAHGAGVLVCLDLSHAVGSVPVDLEAWGADVAVGCTYKHLCGGPGAPAFVYVRQVHHGGGLRRPAWGWWAQRDQFEMGAAFSPWDDARGWLAGTPPVLGLAAVEEGVALVAAAGIEAVRAKSMALGSLALELVDELLVPLGFEVASPRAASARGAHLSIAHPDAMAVGAAARAVGVVPDVRPPDLVRLGFAALSTRYVEVFDGIARLAAAVGAGEHEAWRSTHVARYLRGSGTTPSCRSRVMSARRTSARSSSWRRRCRGCSPW